MSPASDRICTDFRGVSRADTGARGEGDSLAGRGPSLPGEGPLDAAAF